MVRKKKRRQLHLWKEKNKTLQLSNPCLNHRCNFRCKKDWKLIRASFSTTKTPKKVLWNGKQAPWSQKAKNSCRKTTKIKARLPWRKQQQSHESEANKPWIRETNTLERWKCMAWSGTWKAKWSGEQTNKAYLRSEIYDERSIWIITSDN